MKLLFVLEDFTLGGVENVTLRLVQGLRRNYNNLDIIFCYEGGDDTLLSLFESEARCVEIVGGNLMEKVFSFRSIINCFQPDIIIYTKGGLTKYQFFSPRKCYSFVIQHVPICLPYLSFLHNVARRIAASILYRMINKVICVSDGIKKDLIDKKVANKKNIVRIYNPVLDKNKDITYSNDVEYDDYFVCVGRLHFQKGYDTLIEVVNKYVRYNKCVKVVILGAGPLEFDLKNKVAEYNLSSNIIFHGKTLDPMPYIYNSKAILLTSRWEGLPTVLVEASYLKKQIISFDCDYGPRELTKEGSNGYLVRLGDIDGFCKAMIEVESNPKPTPNIDEFHLDKACEIYFNWFKWCYESYDQR